MVSNFRGARALLLMPDDANRAALAATLTRLGVIVSAEDPYDVAFYDADEGSGQVELPASALSIAVIGSEAPSRLLRVARHGSLSHVVKPIRGAGVFAALVLAFNAHVARRRAEAERLALEGRVKGRREVVKAVLRLMREHDLDDDAAYGVLRVESMRRRTTVEAFAAEVAAAPTVAALIRSADPPERKINSTFNRR
jgi:AmiR/NasT family two-component response regulator